jgi:hypothetical protein
VEMEAIRDRSFDDGWEFFKLLMISSNFSPPAWVPRSHIWVGLDRYGIDGVAKILDSRLQEVGASPRLETSEVIALRQAQKRRFMAEREKLRQSNEAVQLLKSAFKSLSHELLEKVNGINEIPDGPKVQTYSDPETTRIENGTLCIEVRLDNKFPNALTETCGIVLERKMHTGKHTVWGYPEFIVVRTDLFAFDYLEDTEWRFVSRGKRDIYSAEMFAEYAMKVLLKSLE